MVLPRDLVPYEIVVANLGRGGGIARLEGGLFLVVDYLPLVLVVLHRLVLALRVILEERSVLSARFKVSVKIIGGFVCVWAKNCILRLVTLRASSSVNYTCALKS